MNKDVNQAIQKITTGAGIILFATFILRVFELLERIIVARWFSTHEYGIFNLTLTIFQIALVIASLGFLNSLPREISIYKIKNNFKIDKLISTALGIMIINSMIWMSILFFGANIISNIFKDNALIYPLKTISLALPFSIFIEVLISISRGFGRVRERVYFRNILSPFLFLIFIVFGIYFVDSFLFIFFAYLIAQILTLSALIFDINKSKIFKIKIYFDLELGKNLMALSIPLSLSGVLLYIMNWTDTLMIGYYKGSESVGLYNAVSPIAKILPVILGSTGFLYSPLASQLYATQKLEELREIYQLLTKWIFLMTLPLFVAITLFPEKLIILFFGFRYTSVALTLQILAFGFMFHTIMGLNQLSLTVIGDTMFILLSTIGLTVLNIILNMLLIPIYGITGAAIATTVSYIFNNILMSLRLYKKTGIHPFTRNYITLLIINVILILLFQAFKLTSLQNWDIILILIGFLSMSIVLAFLSNAINKKEVILLLSTAKKLCSNR